MSIEDVVNRAFQKTVQLQELEEGDVVATPRDERGVVAAVMQEDFEFPTGPGEGQDDIVTVEATNSNEAYIVGFGGASAVYRLEDLEQSSFKEGAPESSDSNEEPIAEVSHLNFDETDLPEGWDQQSFLDFWASVIDPDTEQGMWEDMVDALRGEPDFLQSGIDPEQMASDWKDNLLGTDRWRNRF